MPDQQKTQQNSGARAEEIRTALDQHWAASDANDFETEHRIYLEDAVLEYPQSGSVNGIPRHRGMQGCSIQIKTPLVLQQMLNVIDIMQHLLYLQ